jgi:hypothetical protein
MLPVFSLGSENIASGEYRRQNPPLPEPAIFSLTCHQAPLGRRVIVFCFTPTLQD